MRLAWQRGTSVPQTRSPGGDEASHPGRTAHEADGRPTYGPRQVTGSQCAKKWLSLTDASQKGTASGPARGRSADV